ncbi:MAG: glycosyltransferase [Planctomycetota bacterium]|nr:glycosyltransferase [Planctomycetota bacterium]
MKPHVITFTNLFPSQVMPQHGLFVRERMRRVAMAGGFQWTVVAPVPDVVWPLRRGVYRRWAAAPATELLDGVTVHHPRFRHWPGMSQRRQAAAVREGARSLLRKLCEDGPAVIDAHYLWPDGVAAGELARELGVPYTLTARGSDINVLAEHPAIAARIADVAARAHQCMAVSDTLGARFASAAGLPTERVKTVRNGVDLARFCPGDRAAARSALGLPASGALALGVGRLVPGKGFDVAARAVGQLQGLELVLIGEGDARRSIEVAGDHRVTFLGAQPPERVALAYQAADVFVLPSEREGWPNVVTEALAAGLPVVATRVGGIPQILGDPPSEPLGALVEPGDVDGLAAALSVVLSRGARRDEVRAYSERYGWDEPVAELVETFRSAVEGAR